MRLICPNCAAQYEVDEAAIPESGRDVQCSNCGHTWWQDRAGLVAAVAAAEPEPGAEGPGLAAAGAAADAGTGPGAAARWPVEDTSSPVDEPLPAPALAGPTVRRWPEAPAEQPAAPAGTRSTWPEAPPETVAAGGGPAPVPAPDAAPGPAAEPASDHDETMMQQPLPRTPRSLDDAVLSVLREEAEREARVRRFEGAAPAESTPAAESVSAPAPLLAPGPDAEAPATLADAAEDDSGRPERRIRRSKLPDVDEINSTLSSQQAIAAGTGRHVETGAPAAGRTGFRVGFALMIVAAIIIGGLYSYADRITAAAPATAPAMDAFVGIIDSLRALIDRAALSATEAITSLSGGSG